MSCVVQRGGRSPRRAVRDDPPQARGRTCRRRHGTSLVKVTGSEDVLRPDCHTLRYLVASESIVSSACRESHNRSGSVATSCKAIEHPDRTTANPASGRSSHSNDVPDPTGDQRAASVADTVELAEQRLPLKLEMTEQRAWRFIVEAARWSSVDSPNHTRRNAPHITHPTADSSLKLTCFGEGGGGHRCPGLRRRQRRHIPRLSSRRYLWLLRTGLGTPIGR